MSYQLWSIVGFNPSVDCFIGPNSLPCPIYLCLLPYDFAQGKTKCISLALNFGLGYVLDLSDGKGQKPRVPACASPQEAWNVSICSLVPLSLSWEEHASASLHASDERNEEQTQTWPTAYCCPAESGLDQLTPPLTRRCLSLMNASCGKWLRLFVTQQ